MSTEPIFWSRTAVVLFAIILLLPACAHQPSLYSWGSYEYLVYATYAKPGDADPGRQVATLSQEIAAIESSDRQVPPGVYAHLGYQYFLLGNVTAGLEAFAAEKALYPESKHFIEGMEKRFASQHVPIQ